MTHHPLQPTLRWARVCALLLCFTASAHAKENVRTGWDFAGLPLVNFTTDRGMGYGAYVAAFYHGPEGAGDAPYRASIGGQFYQTTGGYAFHKFLLDIPNIAETGARFDLKSGYETWDSAWFFGVGDATPRLTPDDTPDGYYTSGLKSLWAIPTLRLPISGPWEVFLNYVYRSTDVEVFPDTRLAEDSPDGVEGGTLSMGSVGFAYDTRDREPSTLRGVFSEGSVRLAHPAIGADWRFLGANLTHRHWVPLWRDTLVFAYRLGFDWTRGATPFFHQHILGGTEWVEMGGNVALRGLPNGRYRGPITAYSNLELRWTLGRYHWGPRTFDVLVAPFVDLGRIWGDGGPAADGGIHASAGGGARLVYNDVFVVRFDIAAGLEEYTSTDAPRGTATDHRRPVLGVYAIVGHPF